MAPAAPGLRPNISEVRKAQSLFGSTCMKYTEELNSGDRRERGECRGSGVEGGESVFRGDGSLWDG